MVRSNHVPSILHALTHLPDDNKTKIAKSGALVPLTRLARSKDMRVQRNATGALLNMTHSGVPTAASIFYYIDRSPLQPPVNLR